MFIQKVPRHHNHDGVYRKILCITLLVVAFTFVVILVSLFIDINGWITNNQDKFYKEQEKQEKPENLKFDIVNEQENGGETNESGYRIKRSLDSSNFTFHIKNPQLNNILTNHLTTLLEELDKEESKGKLNRRELLNKKSDEKLNEETIRRFNLDSDLKDKEQDDENILHLAMHNILLQGIRGYLDLNEVYKRMHILIKKFEQNMSLKNIQFSNPIEKINTFLDIKATSKSKESTNEENIFLEELIKRVKLINENSSIRGDSNQKTLRVKAPKILIKTEIDIKSSTDDVKNERDNKDSIKGIVKLVFNGKSIKVDRIEDSTDDTAKNSDSDNIVKKYFKILEASPTTLIKDSINIDDQNSSHISPTNIQNLLYRYYKKYPPSNHKDANSRINVNRSKRHVKVRLLSNKNRTQTNKPAIKKNITTHDDELFVEIETNFHDKDLKNEKKQLVTNLINKIQKVIQSQPLKTVNKSKKKDHKAKHIRKRNQHLLENLEKNLVDNNNSYRLDNFRPRELYPFSKSVPLTDPHPNITDKSGNKWEQKNFGPRIFTASKAINSAEMSEVDIDYSKVLKINGIPQRLQKPLYSDMNEESDDSNVFYNMGNLNFYIKEIDGTGFAIGINQYVDEAPDTESLYSLKEFNNEISPYDKNYDYKGLYGITNFDNKINFKSYGKYDFEDNYKGQRHRIRSRSVNDKDQDEHNNKYKITYDTKYKAIKDYQKIYNKENKIQTINQKSAILKNESEKNNNLNLLLSNNIFEEKLNPSQIFSLANLFPRQKRSMNMKKLLLNINPNKNILYKLLESNNKLKTKKIYLGNRRNKREIEKIKIVASDNLPERSDENLFLVSNENLFANRAVIEEYKKPEPAVQAERTIEKHYDYYSPFIYDTPETHFERKSRRNNLMSKYPHIFLEEISGPKEVDFVDNPLTSENVNINSFDTRRTYAETFTDDPLITLKDSSGFEVQNIPTAISPNSNYKLTIKVLPNNETKTQSGFKEMHTFINKKFNKNGLMYSSLVNVSEISRVEKLNKSSEAKSKPLTKHIKEQQEYMKLILKQHKEKINNQLNNLKEKKEKLDNFTDNIDELNDSKNKLNEIIEIVLPFDQPQVLHLKKVEAGKLFTSALIKLQNLTNSEHIATTFNSILRTAPPTVTPSTIEPEKLKMLNSIQNENLTHEILSKINKNTEILTSFLQKVTNQWSSPRQRDEIYKNYRPPEALEDNNISKYWKGYPIPEAFFQHSMNNFEFQQNNSQIRIPFIYAYQQPFPLPNKSESTIANVLYHGHLHTSAINNVSSKEVTKNEKLNPNNTKVTNTHAKHILNETKFFIDELENDYKIIPKINVNKNIYPIPVVTNRTVIR